MTSNHNYTRIIHPDTRIKDYSAGLLMLSGKVESAVNTETQLYITFDF